MVKVPVDFWLLCPWDFPARILEWVAISSSRTIPDPGIELESPTVAGRFFTTKSPDTRHLPKHFAWILTTGLGGRVTEDETKGPYFFFSFYNKY